METDKELFQASHVVEGPDWAQNSQAEITAEIQDVHAGYRKGVADGLPVETQPRLDFAPYRSSILRCPTKDLHHTDPETIELWWSSGRPTPPAATSIKTTTMPGARRTSTSRCSARSSPSARSPRLDPIYQSIADQSARDALVATYDHNVTSHEWATGYNWDTMLTGSHRTWMEDEDAES